MYVCIVNHAGDIVFHKHMQAAPDPFLQAVAPDREGLVVAVACLCTCSGLADLCACAGRPCVLGQALSRKAIHGGKTQHDKLDAQTSAVLLRGGMLPPADGSPAARRATRDLLRRRMSRPRNRAELLGHGQQTKSPYPLPDIGKKLADTAHRTGVAERFPAPAGQHRVAGDLPCIGYAAPLLRALA
jgi:hypothetical protein